MGKPLGTILDVTSDIERDPWSDYADRDLRNGEWTRIGLLRNGTTGGRATVAVAVELPDGTVVFGETTLRLFRIASAAVLATPIAVEEPLD